MSKASKISLEEIQSILSEREDIAPETRREIIAEAEKRLKEEAEDKDPKEKKGKYEFIALVNEAQLDLPLRDAAIFIAKMPQDGNFELVHPTLRAACVNFNETKKGRKNPLKTFTEAMQFLKQKNFVDDVSRADIFDKKSLKLLSKGEPAIVTGIPWNILAE